MDAPSRPPRIGRLLAAFPAAAGLALFALALASTPRSPLSGPLLVQSAQGEIRTGRALQVELAREPRPGDLLVASLVWTGGGAASLSGGGSWQSAVGPTAAGAGRLRAQIFYARDARGAGRLVTASFADDVSERAALSVHEYSGLSRLSPLEAAAAASGGPGAVEAAVTTRSSRALVFGAVASADGPIDGPSAEFAPLARGAGELLAAQVAGRAGTVALPGVRSPGAWVAQLAAFTYTAADPSGARYPVRARDAGRTLEDETGAPFLLWGDSPQALFANVSESQADAFLANRALRGFNTVWVNLLCAKYTGGRANGSTFDGLRPFTRGLDLATPNEAYFARVDEMLRLAARHGILVVLDPAETGSFLEVLRENGQEKAHAYGRYLGARYGSFENILWMHGNDFHLAELPTAAENELVQAVALGIQETDPHHIHTVELNYFASGSLDAPSWRPLIQLNASYTYHPTYAQVLRDYRRGAGLPTFMVEANYEFENDAKRRATPFVLRRQAYWSLLSGAAGHLYGNRYTWPFVPGWQAHLDTPGVTQLGLAKQFFESLPWFELVPDDRHETVTSGLGTFSDKGEVSDNDYLTAARTEDGSLVVAYLPTARTIEVDLSRVAAPAEALWFDPSRGTWTPVGGPPLAGSGRRGFTPPGPNADGDGDWVLVLRTSHKAE